MDSFLTELASYGSRMRWSMSEVFMGDENGTNELYATVTAEQFDRDPAAVYRRATNEGPVTVLDSKGRPSMTVVVPRAPEPLAAE